MADSVAYPLLSHVYLANRHDPAFPLSGRIRGFAPSLGRAAFTLKPFHGRHDDRRPILRFPSLRVWKLRSLALSQLVAAGSLRRESRADGTSGGAPFWRSAQGQCLIPDIFLDFAPQQA
jgi:hypothetical protein